MTTCPFPSHTKPHPLRWDSLIVASCREGCGRTLFSCPNCKEANRPLSRYCRQCGEAVSFVETQALQERDRLPREGRSEIYKLSGYGVKDVQALKNFKGFLIVIGDHCVLLYDLHKIHEPLYQFHAPDGGHIRGVTKMSTPDDELLVVTSSRGVYSLSLLTLKVADERLYVLPPGPRYITHPAIFSGGRLYVLELDERAQSTRLMRLPDEEVIRFDGISRSPLNLDDQRFFFSTRDHVFLYDDAVSTVLNQRFPESLAETDVTYSPELQALYLVGESGLWKLSLLGNNLTPVALATRLLSASHVAAQGDNVFVAHSQGFTILDPFGGVRWESTQQFIRAGSDGLTPQLTEEYVLFTALGHNAGSDLRIHLLQNPNDFKTFSYDERLLCPPLLTLGRVFGVTGGGATLELSCTI
jgi:hypothetical protein